MGLRNFLAEIRYLREKLAFSFCPSFNVFLAPKGKIPLKMCS